MPSTGLEVSALAVEPEEVAQKLEIRYWRFHVKLPDGDLMLRQDLVLRRPGEEPRVIGGLGIIPSQPIDEEVLVALDPLDTSFLGAKRLKFYLGSSGVSTAGVIDNPCDEQCTLLAPSTPARLSQQGDFELMRFSRGGGIPTEENTVLALRFSAVQPEKP